MNTHISRVSFNMYSIPWSFLAYSAAGNSIDLGDYLIAPGLQDEGEGPNYAYFSVLSLLFFHEDLKI